MDWFYDSIKIMNNCCNIIKNNTITIDNIIFITDNYIDYNNEVNASKNVYLITNSEMIKKYDKNGLKLINNDKYYLEDKNDIIKRMKENDNYNWKNSDGECLIDIDDLYFINLFAEVFNTKDINYTCLKYEYDIMENMKCGDIKNTVAQYVLLFDYMEIIDRIR
jgi:hypothetical protein